METKTKIIATLGPASRKDEVLSNLIKHVDIIRLNFSWGSHEEHLESIEKVRNESNKNNLLIPMIQDLSGPRIQDGAGHHFGGATEVITEKDIDDLTFGIKNSIEYIALSFVGDKNDIIKLRSLIKERGGNQKIIAKIERKEAVENLIGIIEGADGIMIARGDLGNEFPLEKIPFVQHHIIVETKKRNKMVIVATQMLLSMVNSPTPTRAEVSDVAYAILDGADGIMLSEESAIGKYPLEAVQMMEKIAQVSETHRNSTIIG